MKLALNINNQIEIESVKTKEENIYIFIIVFSMPKTDKEAIGMIS